MLGMIQLPPHQFLVLCFMRISSNIHPAVHEIFQQQKCSHSAVGLVEDLGGTRKTDLLCVSIDVRVSIFCMNNSSKTFFFCFPEGTRGLKEDSCSLLLSVLSLLKTLHFITSLSLCSCFLSLFLQRADYTLDCILLFVSLCLCVTKI